ncbi:MAG: hypothetical protein NTW87_10235 [Planctomycetota bacterium]|nr:hypothetical protein [Planctomycetota bacterium]
MLLHRRNRRASERPTLPSKRFWRSRVSRWTQAFESGVYTVSYRRCRAGRCTIALLFTTGSQAHLEDLQELAASRGLRLNEAGLWRGPQERLFVRLARIPFNAAGEARQAGYQDYQVFDADLAAGT